MRQVVAFVLQLALSLRESIFYFCLARLNMPRVLVADQLPPEGLAILKAATNIELDTRTGLKGDDLKKALAESDAVIVRSATKLKADDLAGQKRLKVIVRAGAGVDTIDLPAATRQGIVVMNTPGGNTLSTAEQTIALLLALARHTAAADASMRAGKWDRSKFVGTQLAGKTIGIVGLGRIGLAVAKRCLAFEMNVVGYDPFMSADRAKSLGIETVSDVEDIYAKVDIITVHVPLSDDTNALVGAKQIAKLKKGSWIINCARGGIVDEAALYDGLKSGHLGGAALDVYKTEPAVDLPFVSLPNVVLTPHLGASTNEAQLNVAIEAAELIADFFKTGNVRFAVNMASIDQAELEGVRRHLDIAHRLGLMHAQLAKGPIKKATLRYSGEAAKKKTSLITASFTIGLLGRRLEEQVNLVNAKVKAEERGIQIDESITA